MNDLSQKYWENRWLQGQTGWDLGSIAPPLKRLADQLVNKDEKILIPGAGNGYEAEYLFQKGFNNVYVVDIADAPLRKLQTRVPDFPSSQLINCDFFDLKLNVEFDLIVEHTFFCALDPRLRSDYAAKVFELLKPGGVLSGLMFSFPLSEQGPPFGGSKDEYLSYFREYTSSISIEVETISAKGREGKEYFIKAVKK